MSLLDSMPILWTKPSMSLFFRSYLRSCPKPLVVNPLSVAIQPCGKKRLILDLRHVNKCLVKQRVRYEDWKFALAYFTKGSYMFSFDLKNGYHHVEISQDYQTYLGFWG